MLKLLLLGCGVGVAYFAGRFGADRIKEKIVKRSAGDDASPMSILAKGVLCVQKNLGPWSPQDAVLGLVAMSKVTEKQPLEVPGSPVGLANDPNFLMKAQHWRALAEAIYVTEASSFSLFSQLSESFIVTAQYSPDQDSLRPAYALALDPSFGALVLSVRGTFHVMDVLVSAGTSPVPFMGGHAHGGFVRATESLIKETKPYIDDIFREADRYNVKKLVIVGHSMGAAVAVLCGLMLRDEYEDLECWAYSVPASVSMDLAKQCSSFATCFIGLHDVVPRFSLASVEELRHCVCNFDWQKAEEIAGGDEDWEKLSKAVQLMESFRATGQSIEQKTRDFQSRVCRTVSRNETCSEQEDCSSSGVDPPAMHPPGRLLVLASEPPGCGKTPSQRSGVAQQRNYGAFPSFEEAKQVHWKMHEVSQEDLYQIVLSPWSVSDHVLGHLCEGISFFQRSCASAAVSSPSALPDQS